MIKLLILFFDFPIRLLFVLTGRVECGRRSAVRHSRLRVPNGAKVVIGKDCVINCRVDFDRAVGRVTIGDRTFIGKSHFVCSTAITVGDDVLVSWGVTVVDHDSHSLNWSYRKDDVLNLLQGKKEWNHIERAPVILEDKVWVGFGATILKGVTVGEGAIVGACSVVTRNVPPFTVVVGNPARVIRELIQDG